VKSVKLRLNNTIQHYIFEVEKLSKMCTMESCKAKEGMCIHEKIIVVIVVVLILAAVARYLGVA